jgi:hypothetical protein
MIAERLTAQLLAGPPAGDAVTVARRLLAVQGQDQRGARLAIRARTTGLSATEVDRELTEERSLLITWLNRGTLHLVCSEDYHWLHVLTTPPLQNGNARRLAQEGVTPAAAERGMRVIERSLADEGPLTRTQRRARVLGGRRSHRAPGARAPAHAREPARDRGARADGRRGDRPPAAELPGPRLLGAFDPVLLGWSSREEILGSAKTIVTVNGLFRPFALVRARAVATWRLTAGEVVLEPFAPLARDAAAALRADARDVLRYLGASRPGADRPSR